MPSQLRTIVSWEAFAVANAATRAETLANGRAACKIAFGRAAADWAAQYGSAPWTNAAIDHEDEGAPVLRAPGAPRISLCHTRGLAGCAIAAPGEFWVGIDAEPANAPGARAVRELATRAGEANLPWTDEVWPSRLWCAKEAVVKAERTAADLLGQTLRVIGVSSAGPPAAGASAADDRLQVLLVRSHHGRVFSVHTWHADNYVTASVAALETPAPLP